MKDDITEFKGYKTTYDRYPTRSDEIRYDFKNLDVELIDHSLNPYRSIFENITATWGNKNTWWNRWENCDINTRIEVVTTALNNQTLPAPLETCNFTFNIRGLSRGAFDQLARSRRTVIGSIGTRDICHRDTGIILHPNLEKFDEKIKVWWKHTKDLYDEIIGVNSNNESWQTARYILPLSIEWRFVWSLNYKELQHMCSQRMCFVEQWDTVGTAWAISIALSKKFPLLAAFIRPQCDKKKRCVYDNTDSKSITYSNIFPNLFSPCGRYKLGTKNYTIFDEISTRPSDISKMLDYKIPGPDDWDKIVKDAIKADYHYFEK